MNKILNILVVVLVLFAASCAAPKRIIYFNEDGNVDSNVQVQNLEKRTESVIQADDILAINVTTISTLNDKTISPSFIFNNGGTQFSILATSGSNTTSVGTTSGYLVDNSGFIDYPVLGKIEVAGLTIRSVKEIVAKKLKEYVTDPVVEVRIINYKVTVLGEVVRPGAVVAPNHKINILDALAAAGDIPVTGKKDNVLVVRENAGKREFARLNLNSKDIFNSPYFYLRQNDIVYVEPAKVRRQETNEFFRFYLPAISSLVSTALAIYGIISVTQK